MRDLGNKRLSDAAAVWRSLFVCIRSESFEIAAGDGPQFRENRFLAGSPNNSGAETSVNEVQERRNRLNSPDQAEIGIVVGVDLDDFHEPGTRGCNFLQHCIEDLTRTAPSR